MPVVSGAYFPAAGAVVNDFLLVFQIAEVCTNHRTKLIIGDLSARSGVDRRERAENKQQKSGKSSLDTRHRFAPGGRQYSNFLAAARLYQPLSQLTLKPTKLRASFGNV